MKITQLSVEEKQTLKEIFSRSPLVLNFINDQSRQEKVIGCIAFFCKCLIYFFIIRCVDLRQKRKSQGSASAWIFCKSSHVSGLLRKFFSPVSSAHRQKHPAAQSPRRKRLFFPVFHDKTPTLLVTGCLHPSVRDTVCHALPRNGSN